MERVSQVYGDKLYGTQIMWPPRSIIIVTYGDKDLPLAPSNSTDVCIHAGVGDGCCTESRLGGYQAQAEIILIRHTVARLIGYASLNVQWRSR
jgi:hypothetical protein